MAKHSHIETTQFEHVTYSCDICGQNLLPGQSPKVCRVCGRESCHQITACYWLISFPGDLHGKIVCRPCYDLQSVFLAEIYQAFVQYGNTEGEQLCLWREMSLKQEIDHAA